MSQSLKSSVAAFMGGDNSAFEDIYTSAYYDKNRNCGTAMYTDHAIYSPDVPFFRSADYELLEEPVTASILTLPAVNMGQVREKRESIEKAKSVMKHVRIRRL